MLILKIKSGTGPQGVGCWTCILLFCGWKALGPLHPADISRRQSYTLATNYLQLAKVSDLYVQLNTFYKVMPKVQVFLRT